MESTNNTNSLLRLGRLADIQSAKVDQDRGEIYATLLTLYVAVLHRRLNEFGFPLEQFDDGVIGDLADALRQQRLEADDDPTERTTDEFTV